MNKRVIIVARDPEQLKRDIAMAGYSQMALARKIGVHKTTLWRVLIKDHPVTPKMAMKIRDALGKDWSDIWDIADIQTEGTE